MKSRIRHHPAGGTGNEREEIATVASGVVLLRSAQQWLNHYATTADALVMPKILCRRFRFFPSVVLAFTIHFPYRMRRTRLTAPLSREPLLGTSRVTDYYRTMAANRPIDPKKISNKSIAYDRHGVSCVCFVCFWGFTRPRP